MTIEIKTKLAEGIYKSSGGGATTSHYDWATGPRNLIKAIAVLADHSADMTQGYGNIGHVASWVEVDGVPLDGDDIWYMEADTDPSIASHPISRTQWAKDIIASIRDV